MAPPPTIQISLTALLRKLKTGSPDAEIDNEAKKNGMPAACGGRHSVPA
ncbi:hypothetical protein ACFQ49_08665 [Kroppenstedtia eburnea]|nr:hypothetical protein [Kroppenstedtia eburnea]QKI81951.1 hypothetical protein GXN75_08015 [Kroppenstedtia eburnea]